MRRHFAVITVALAAALLPLRAEAAGTILGCDTTISVPSLAQNFAGQLIADLFVHELAEGKQQELTFHTLYKNRTFNGAPYFGVGSGGGTHDLFTTFTQISFNVAFPGTSPSGPDINQQSVSVQGNFPAGPFTGKTFSIRQDGQFGRNDANLILTNCRNFVDP